jgi:hypothetical protein
MEGVPQCATNLVAEQERREQRQCEPICGTRRRSRTSQMEDAVSREQALLQSNRHRRIAARFQPYRTTAKCSRPLSFQHTSCHCTYPKGDGQPKKLSHHL